MLTIKLKLKDVLHITVLYRSPSGKKREFLNIFEEWCERNFEKGDKHLVCVDFNIDWKSENLYTKTLRRTINDAGVKQYVSDFTRTTKDSKTLYRTLVYKRLYSRMKRSQIIRQ